MFDRHCVVSHVSPVGERAFPSTGIFLGAIQTPAPLLRTYIGNPIYTTPDAIDEIEEPCIAQLDVSDVLFKEFGEIPMSELYSRNKRVQLMLSARGMGKPANSCDASGMHIDSHNGRKALTVKEYLQRITIDKPRVVIALADEVSVTIGKKRLCKATERSAVWFHSLVTSATEAGVSFGDIKDDLSESRHSMSLTSKSVPSSNDDMDLTAGIASGSSSSTSNNNSCSSSTGSSSSSSSAQSNKKRAEEEGGSSVDASSGKLEIDGEDVMYFMRSAWMQSPQYTSVFWLGDQMVTWDRHDGIKSVLVGAITSGIGGHSLTHSDIGGYTMQEVGPLPFVRTRELLLRWMELAAFGSALFRSHIGLITSPNNAQVYHDEVTMTHFAQFAKIFAHLADYRSLLMQEAAQKGWPLIRHMAAHYAYDEQCWSLVSQYMFGTDFLIAPVLDPATVEIGMNAYLTRNKRVFGDYLSATVKVYLPQHTTWVHLWSGQVVEAGPLGRFVSVDAPMGAPPVFYVPTSLHGKSLREFVVKELDMNVQVGTPNQREKTDQIGASISQLVSPYFVEQQEERLPSDTHGPDSKEQQTDVSIDTATMREITDYAEYDWYDWLGIKQYVSVPVI